MREYRIKEDYDRLVYYNKTQIAGFLACVFITVEAF